MAKKKHRQGLKSPLENLEDDPLDSDEFYWRVLRLAEDAETPRKRVRKAQATPESFPAKIQPEDPPDEASLVAVLDAMIRTTHHAYGYRHLGELGQQLRAKYPTLVWEYYGCKKLLQFLEKYPEVFRIKWQSPARKGASHVWVRLAYEPKRKAGYE